MMHAYIGVLIIETGFPERLPVYKGVSMRGRYRGQSE